MWARVELPYLFERMIAFSIPEGDEIWVLGIPDDLYVFRNTAVGPL